MEVFLRNKTNNEISIRSSCAEYITYVSAIGDNAESIEMRYEDENIWLTQKMMAELYGVDVRTINDHIHKIYIDGELKEESTIRNYRIVQNEGNRQVSRELIHYNLQMIIAVGFKVNNERAVQFRKWANRNIPMTMEDWNTRLDKFLLATDRDILNNAGKISMEIATEHALTQFEKYRVIQDKLYKNDFDKMLEETNKIKNC